jgi:hypothetical protein
MKTYGEWITEYIRQRKSLEDIRGYAYPVVEAAYSAGLAEGLKKAMAMRRDWKVGLGQPSSEGGFDYNPTREWRS